MGADFLGGEMACTATITGMQFGAGNIDFEVEASCTDSRGLIEYEYTVERLGVIGNPIPRTCAWPLQLGQTKFVVQDNIILGAEEKFHSVTKIAITCTCLEGIAVTESAYVFDRVYPPLIKDYRDPASQLNLGRREGPLTWSVLDKTYGGNAETANITEISNDFETWRTSRWVPILNVRYVEDRKEKVTTRHSYTRTEHEEIKKTLTVQGKLSLPDIGAFKGGLDITATQIWDSLKRLTEVWADSKDIEEDRTFKAHKRYIFWQLIETLDITVTTRSTTYDITAVGGPKIPIKSVIDWNNKAKVASVVGYFEDDGSDPGKNIR